MPRNRRLPWPASQIDRDILHELHVTSKRLGLPITHLIKDAVHSAMNDAFQRNQPAPIGFTQSVNSQQQTAASP